MIKKTITFTDYNGTQRTEDFYFNLNKAELMEMDLSALAGSGAMRDSKKVVEICKELILKSYGEKSPDGRKFLKFIDGKRLSDDFAQTEAYSELFMEIATDEQAASDFINGIMPRSLFTEADNK